MRAAHRFSVHVAPWLLALAVLPSAGCGGSDTETGGTSSSSAPRGPLGEREDLAVDEELPLANMGGAVDVVRDRWGRAHIYASSTEDAMRVEGYLVAKDRTLQLEILRRIAEGRMAEMLAAADPSLIDTDIAFRHIGLHRVAKAQYAALPEGEVKAGLDAFADGVTQAYAQIRSGALKLPDGIFGIDEAFFTDWTAVDTLAIGRLQTYLLSYDGDVDIEVSSFFDASRATFRADAEDPLDAKRAGFERDFLRFAPATKATTTHGYPETSAKSVRGGERPGRTARPAKADVPVTPAPPMTKAQLEKQRARGAQAKGYLGAIGKVRALLAAEGFGSNNWGISPSRSATGHTLIASDPHLNLTAPSIFYPVSIEVAGAGGAEALRVGGVAFPGIPGIILGHNEHVAWGATVAGYDVTDAYGEELSADGASVKFEGKDVALETIEESIVIQGKDEPYVYTVQVVPHHGPIVPVITGAHEVAAPDPAVGAISIKWTGLEATDEIAAVFGLMRAKDVDEAYAALQAFGVGAQNWMIGDTSGNLLWTSHARVPVRDAGAFAWDAASYSGTLPCFVLPGDGSAEWKGFLADGLVPWVKNPLSGWIATANNDPIGDTLDNDPSNDALPDGTPMYLASSFDLGFREERIQQRIEAHPEPFTLDDLAAIQADHHSPMGSRLAPRLVAALDRAEAERKLAGSHPDLAGLVKDAAYDPERIGEARALLDVWGAQAGFEAASGVDPENNEALAADSAEGRASQATLLFNVWLVRVLRRTFGDELGKLGYTAFFREAEAKSFLRLLEADPAQLATFDAATGDSAIWDDAATPEIESRDERMVRAMLDALAWVDSKGGLDGLRWGALHTVRFGAMVPVFGALSIPPAGDATFPEGFPRHGDSFAVDNADFSFATALGEEPSFGYAHGPSQRFVIDLDPAGVKAFNALPGGAVWDAESPHFDDEAQLWRRNQTHAVPFALEDVVAEKESRTVVYTP